MRHVVYQEVAHTPLFIWDPRSKVAGERRQSLVQMIDMPATLLDYFDVEGSDAIQGKSLTNTVANDSPVREAALFGIFGGHVNVTDGQYVYMRGPQDPEFNGPLFEHTLMPTHMSGPFSVNELRQRRIG